jgi:uncharacterized protein
MQIILAGLIIIITHAMETITGFGCTVLAMPFMIQLIGMQKAKIILSTLALILALYIVATKYKKINFREFGIIILFTAIGMPLGLYFFKAFDPFWLKKCLAVFIIISSIIQLRMVFSKRSGSAVPEKRNYHDVFYYFLLICGGVIHGAFTSGGPLVVLYAARRLKDKGEFRATLCLLWATLNGILFITYIGDNVLTHETGINILLMLPFLVAGIILGELIHNKVNAGIFKKVVFFVLLLVGVIMLLLK